MENNQKHKGGTTRESSSASSAKCRQRTPPVCAPKKIIEQEEEKEEIKSSSKKSSSSEDLGKLDYEIIDLHLRQTHISLSISKHIKDAVNAIDFELPVDKEFYDKVKIGSEIVDEFRMGSLVLSGSFRSCDIFIYK